MCVEQLNVQLLHETRLEIVLKFNKILAGPSLLYGNECWTLTKKEVQQTEAIEMRSLRPVAVCQRIDQRKNEDIRQEQNMFGLSKNE
jgi:hypothetical protein